ncbi:hypothetical protein [Oceanisphaera arctica]|uniref:Uncharacterized protein n=1 Tax=Oceanisphaera arctica TaxID=641510 RepID=A0A2P5TPF6_9GAMM|nr:hypothetical protein [Oceanisphaera arctica]PPL17561.1 hypothetical protein UN63_04540 [Oceanisphaera arctica]GHA16228.1 hypothetical protein GCM10007082_16250 [Oceanisphaera arctica]
MRPVVTLLLFMFTLLPLTVRALSPEQVPAPLQPWVDWVLHDEEQRHCPLIHNQGEAYQCAWPTRLALNLGDNGGRFSQQWQLYREGWVLLPGDQKHWPQQVTVNGEPMPVSADKGKPRIRLPAGKHNVEGQWQWDRLPTTLTLNPTTGLLALTINGVLIKWPELDKEGRFWLGQRKTDAEDNPPRGDSLTLQVYRKVEDRIPLQVTTLINLEVAGEQRELLLGPVLPDKQIPLLLNSPLPARLEPDGRLRVQVRPGRWSINLHSRHPAPVTRLALPEVPAPWPEQEVWVFQAVNQLRLVEVENLVSIDPQQTRLPQDWQNLPAYRLTQGDQMQLRVIRRGDREPEPDRLDLQRQLWLDFDGGGYTVQDNIKGRMTRGWRLETTPALQLGRVSIDGTPQFITRQEGSDKLGVEVRRGALNLGADSRYEGDISTLPAVGWDTDLQSLHARLHLPPGWKLFSASGMDNAPNTWLQRWTLLDLFLVLIAAVAAYRLWGWQWGLLALLTLILIWHQSTGMGSPRWVWLHLLAATALLRVLPAGRLRQGMIGYRNLSLLVLLLIAIPFMVAEVRTAMYPQLARASAYNAFPIESEPQVETHDRIRELAVHDQALPATAPLRELADKRSYTSGQSKPLTQIDPDARVQTGPGLPNWQWNSVDLSWNGPVQGDQQIRLVLLSPGINLLLNLLRVGLVSLLVLRMAGVSFSRGRGFHLQQGLLSALIPIGLPLLLLAPLLLALPGTAQAEMPDARLLEQLKTRLLAPPDCLPDCAQISAMSLTASPQQLEVELEVHTQETVAVPLPADTDHWMPRRVLIEGEVAEALLRDRTGTLYLRLPAGIHRVRLSGPLPEQGGVQLPLSLRPHRVEAQLNGWTLQGVDENDVPGAQLQLNRILPENTAQEHNILEPGVLPDFVRVERILRLNLDWMVETLVTRQSPVGQPISIEIPLLAGESVLTDGVRVQDGKVMLTLAANQQQAHWQSRLEKAQILTLTAADTRRWTEVWRVDTSPIWHLESSGIPVIHHQDQTGNWLPEWRPWPGEQIRLDISRPAGVDGQTLTIDNTRLKVQPGKRAIDASLRLQLRSSQGGQHSMQLPDNVELQSVTIDGKVQPIRLQGQTLTFPLTPGAQTLEIHWRHNEGISPLLYTPMIEPGSASVNNNIELELGRDRWILFAMGPRLGPAVLFWSQLTITLLLAVGLSRVTFTPLRLHHWLLLGIGLTQVPLWMALMVVAWLLALGLRGRWQHAEAGRLFNLVQIGLVLLTMAALSYLFYAIQQGLLGLPDMQISGNNSYANTLRWYQDRSEAALPQAWVLSVPLLVYRLLMLAWALWLAFALLSWLRWGWGCFSSHGIWRPFNLRIARGGKKDAPGDKT